MSTKSVLSPLPGIFYRKPSPDEAPFKEEGDPCAIGDVIGIIEVMKSFHEVRSDCTGTAVKFQVENEQAVTAGQPLLEIKE